MGGWSIFFLASLSSTLEEEVVLKRRRPAVVVSLLLEGLAFSRGVEESFKEEGGGEEADDFGFFLRLDEVLREGRRGGSSRGSDDGRGR